VETPSRTPSPVTSIHSDVLSHTRPESRPVQSPSPSLPFTPSGPQGLDPRREKEKDKDKKGLFKWGGGEKKGKKDQREKEKDPGFFGSLFSSKRKPEENAPMGLAHGQSGREAAAALLGASKASRGYVPPASPQPPSVNNYSRYPIHVERAIYRLSHIKLANPRRALYEQVLISNLMFWYLGVINKTQQPQSQQQTQRQTATEQAVAGGPGPASQTEREEKERTELEQAENERDEAKLALQGQGQGQPQGLAQQSPPQGRRGSLTKAPPSNAGTRRAEQPVRGPQYDVQHRAMEQEYGAAFTSARSMTAPSGIGYSIAPGPGATPVQMQMQMSISMSGPASAAASSPHIHATAAAVASTPSAARPATAPRRSRSPPPPTGSPMRFIPPPPPPAPPSLVGHPPMLVSSPVQVSPLNAASIQGQIPEVRAPTRSLSANATPPLGPRSARKAQSAHAVLPPGARRPRTADSVVAVAEEEDVPLALWQQQQYQQSLINQQPRRR